MEETTLEYIEVKDQNQNFKIITAITRVVHYASGWRWCWYQNRRYQVFGGGLSRSNAFIDVSNPILTRAESLAQTKRFFPWAFKD